MSDLLARLIEAGTPAALVAEVAMLAARAETAVEAIEGRRAGERARQQKRRQRLPQDRDVTGCHVTSRDVTDHLPLSPPSPSSPHTPQKPQPPLTPTGDTPRARKGSFPMPEGVDPQHWADFLTNRKLKRLSNTPSAHRRLIEDLRKFADDEWPPGRLVEFAAERGWGAIFDPRKSESRNVHRSYDNRPSGPVEAGRRALAERGFLSDAALDHLPH